MRKVVLNISELNLSAGDVIGVALIDSIGGKCLARNGFSIDEEYTLGVELFEIELLESELVGRQSSYELKLPSSLKLYFEVPPHETNKPHDMLSLCRLGCTKGIINQDRLDDRFIEKLDMYFLGEIPRFSESQKAVVELYKHFADNFYNTTITIDVMQLMDEHLAKTTGDTNG